MRILVATDAWHPQVNGVVRTLTSLARSASTLDAEMSFLTPDGFPSIGVPTYPGLRRKLAFTTSYTTRFPEYIAVRTMIPASAGYAVLRHFHAAASITMVATT